MSVVTALSVVLIVLGFLALVVAIIAVHDLTQRQHAVTRNFPVIGHFRYFFEEMGRPLRQYFFAATAMSGRTIASRVHGCTLRRRVRTTSSVSDPRLTTTSRDGWPSYHPCIQRSRLEA